MDSDDSCLPPSIPIRWLRPTMSTPYLQLPTAPISVANVDSWIALSEEESARCEEAWNALSEEERSAAESEETLDSGCCTPALIENLAGDDETVGVTMAEDRLFEVDVKSMELRPIYWSLNSPLIKVKRATWMYDETRPLPRYLSEQLDAAYKSIQPWQSSYMVELEAAAGSGLEGYEKLKYPIIMSRSAGDGHTLEAQTFLAFEDAYTARIVSKNTTQLFSGSFFGTRNRAAKNKNFPFSGTAVYYGYDAALAANSSQKAAKQNLESHVVKEEVVAATETLGITVDKTVNSLGNAEPRGSNPNSSEHLSRVGDGGRKQVTDLVLIVHGIGQGLVSQYESWSFLYAVNLFRQIAKKQAALPALASILRDKQVQFLPVQWRTSLKLGEEEQREREREGLDNTFSIADITPKKSIPAIRELTNNVLIEVPYFMGRHHDAMIESVCAQANRTYRLWCARNPGFDKHGRVHIIGHSLGSILSAYILSKQPTFQVPLSEMDPETVRTCRDQFLFNASTLFNVGSPLPVFVHLNHAQIIARKGRARTKDSPADEALDREGVFGCLAIDSIYNIFHPSDPIAYLLNPCVDSKSAKFLPPSTVPSFNASVMSSISQRFTRILGDVMPRSFGSSPPLSRAHSPDRRPGNDRVPSTFELSGHNQVLQGSRAERRFAALNPHGTLDFQLNSEGSISEYVDMITAHSSYWQDSDLAAFVLVELFANQQDLARTGLVPGSNLRT